MPRDWKSWLKANAPASSFQSAVGSTSWLAAEGSGSFVDQKYASQADDEDDQEAEGD